MIKLKLTAEPADGRCLSTDELRDLLERAWASGDNGDADLKCKTSPRGLVKEAWVEFPDRALSPAQDFDALAYEARQIDPEEERPRLEADERLELPPPDPATRVDSDILPVPEVRTGQTIEIPAAVAAEGAPPAARRRRRAGLHEKQ